MEGPLDPQHPGQDAGASQPEAQDGDLHALLERLLGQGDVRPSEPGAGDDLWPDMLRRGPGGRRRLHHRAGARRADGRRRAPDRGRGAGRGRRALERAPARAWEPVVDRRRRRRPPTSTTSTRPSSPASRSSSSRSSRAPRPEPVAEPELDLSRYLDDRPEPPAAAPRPRRARAAVPRRAARTRAARAAADEALRTSRSTVDPVRSSTPASRTDLRRRRCAPTSVLDDAASDDVDPRRPRPSNVVDGNPVEPARGRSTTSRPPPTAFALTPFEATEADASADRTRTPTRCGPPPCPSSASTSRRCSISTASRRSTSTTRRRWRRSRVVLPWRSNDLKAAEPLRRRRTT